MTSSAHLARHHHASGGRSRREQLPRGLLVEERPPAGGWERYSSPVVVFVHGSLDRGRSFARTSLRLRDLAVVTYDRRGYQGSRDAGAPHGVPEVEVVPSNGLGQHVSDLLSIADAYASTPRGEPRPVVAIGHSVGGTVVVGAAIATPDRFAAIGAYEPSMPWLGFHRPVPTPKDRTPISSAGPGSEAERFFRRMVGDDAWDRLPEAGRASRIADSAALISDLRSIRGAAPFDVTKLTTPAIVAAGGPSSFVHHRQTAEWLVAHVAAFSGVQIADAGHGAHLSHPDAFAAFVRQVIELGEAREECS